MIKKLLLFVHSLFLNFSTSFKERSFIPGLRLMCLGMFFVLSINYAQCSFGGTQFGTTQSIIYNKEAVSGTNIGTVTFTGVSVGRFVAVNVIQGLTYTISAASNQSFRKRITLFNSANTGTSVGTADATGNNAVVSINWPASFTGILFVRINNSTNCNSTTGNNSTITVTYTGGNNTVDLPNATAEGNNSWIGHVYDFSDTVSINPLTDANAFTNSSYLGYFTQVNTVTGTTTSFTQGYGGALTPTVPFTAAGSSQNFYGETFAIRYRMRSTLPAGCYFVKVRGDDGVRLSIDGVKVFDAWIQQGPTEYTNVLVYLNGNSQLVLDYYDFDEANVTDFTIYPADDMVNSVNSINTPGPVYRCANGGNSVLDGSAITYQGSSANPSIKFQWQSSPDNATWTDINTATAENYTVAQTNPSVTTVVYYRRNITGTATNASSCTYNSESIAVITSQNVNAGTPVSSPATNILCNQFTANWAALGTASGYYLDVSTNNTFSSMVAGYSNLDVGLVTSYNVTGLNPNTTYYYRLRTYNKCSNNTGSNSAVVSTATVSPVATISGNTIICQNASFPNVTFTNPQALPVIVTYNINGGSNLTVNVAASSTANIAVPTTISGGFTYNLVSVAYQSAPFCSNNVSGSATITVLGAYTSGAIATTGETICNGGTPLTTIGNATPASGGDANITYSWRSSADGYTAAISGATLGTYLPPAGLTATTSYRRYAKDGACSTTATVSTGTWTVTVRGAYTSGAIANTGETICNGGTPLTTIGNATPASGGDANITYSWRSSADGYTAAISGATLATYLPPAGLTATTSYRRYAKDGACSTTPTVSTGTWTVTVLGAYTSGAIATTGETICNGGTPTATIGNATPASGGDANITYSWRSSADGYTAAISGATLATYLPPSGLTATTSYRRYAKDVACSTNPTVSTGTWAVTINALPTTPTATVTVQPTCSVNTGTIVVTAPTGAGITYSIDGTNYYTSGTFSNVTIGSYIVRVKNSSDCVTTMPSPLSVLAPVSKTWIGGQGSGSQLKDWNYGPNWDAIGVDDEKVPTSTDCVIIPTTANNPVISGTFSTFNANSLSITGTGSLLVEKGNTLKVENAVKVATTGTLTFEDSSSLLQTTTRDDLNTGDINYMRSTPAPGIRQADYVYWSTPVKNQTLSGVSQDLTLSDKYYMYGGTGVSWIGVPKTTIMEIGKGYIIRGPQNWSNTSRSIYTATFKGTPNNGSFTTHENFKAGKNYLIGNPYPSALYADKLITDNPALEGTLYFWTHNTPVVLVGAYKYEADDYATYNLTGGTIVTKEAAKTGDDDTSYNDDPPSGYIAAGQSFMAAFKAAGEITFTNSMRYGGSHNSQFFKPGKTSKTTGLEKNRVWLNLTNEEGLFKQMLVGYIEGATNNYEGWYDGLSVNGNKYADFYSISSTDKFTIQGRALPFTAADTVPLGYVSSIVGDFTISVDHADGLFDNQPIYLEDKATGKIHDLRTANYTFATEKGTFNDRFVLRYTNKTLGTGDFENVENGLLVAVKDKTIKVTSAKEAIKEVTIFDINGKLLYTKTKVNSSELHISNLQSANQVLLVKVTLENDFTTTKKIIFQ